MASLTALTDVAVQGTEQRTADASVAVQGAEQRTAGLDLLVQTTEQVSAGTSVAVEGTEQRSSAADILVQATEAVGASLDATIEATQQRTAGASVAVQGTETAASSVDITVEGTEQVTAAAEVLIQTTAEVTAGADLIVQQVSEVGAPLNLTVQGTEAQTAGLSLAVEGSVARTADLDLSVQAPFETAAQLDLVVQQQITSSAGMDAAIAELRSQPLCMRVLVTGTVEQSACMDVSVLDPLATWCRSASLSTLVAESRSCGYNLDVSINTGVQASVDVLTVATDTVGAGLDVYLRSPDLQVGGNAVFNCDGDEILAALIVDDGGTLRPELVQNLSATLRFRSQPQGTVTLGPEHASEDGYFYAAWIHPAHTTDMDVLVTGTIETLGVVSLTIPVTTEPLGTRAVGPNVSLLDDTRPRLEEPGTARERQLDAAPEEVEILDPSLEPLMLSLDFSESDPMVVGEGVVEYSGGGNRLLQTIDGEFVFQAKNQPPWELGAYPSLEAAATNLIGNSDFLSPSSSGVPVGWIVTGSSSVTTIPALEPVGSVNAATVRAFGSGNYQGPKYYRLAMSQSVSLAGPTVFSVLARVEFAEDAQIDDLKLVVSLRDATDTEVAQNIATYDPHALDGWARLTNIVSSLPGGVVQARMWVELESIETSDDHTLWVMAPNAQPGTAVSSSIVGLGVSGRSTDSLRVPQTNNIELSRGHVALELTTNYASYPDGTACLFDTRDPLERQGFAGFHLSNGRLRFVVVNATTETVVESLPVALPEGELKTVAFSWTADQIGIYVDDTEVATNPVAVTLPTVRNQYLYLFATTTGGSPMSGQLQSVIIERDPLS